MAASEWLVVAPDTAKEQMVPVRTRIVIGRECVGIPPDKRLLVSDRTVSRNHVEIRVRASGDATLVDLSTNGTLLRGTRVPRATPVPLADGDLIELGETKAVFHAIAAEATGLQMLLSTIGRADLGKLTVAEDHPLGELSDRELEILALMAQGYSDTGIAQRLVVPVADIESHIHQLLLKLGLDDAPELNERVQAVLAYLRSEAGTT